MLSRPAFLIISLAAILATTSIAHADSRRKKAVPKVAQVDTDSRKTTAEVVVRKAANAKARVVGKLPAATAVTVDREEGDWILVRAKIGSGRRAKTITGYIPKSSLDAPAQAATPTPTAANDETSEEGFAAPEPSGERKTTEAVVVRKKPGEKEAVAGNLPAGTVVTVDGEKGRWLKIHAGSVAGYLPRTTVTGPTPATDTSAIQNAPPPNAPEPAKTWRKTEASELAAEATAASQLRADAKADAAVLAEVKKGQKLVVVDATGVAGFIKVRDEQGQVGFIPRAHVGNGSASAAITGSLDTTPSSTRSSSASTTTTTTIPVVRRPLEIRVDAGIGYRLIGMDFTSDGSAGLANYVASADASAANVDVDVAMHPSAKLVVAADAQLGVSRSSPGLDYPGPSGPPGDIPFSTIDVNAGIRAGIRARKMFELAVRAGAHYDAFITRKVDNVGTLPRERLLGTTLGGRVEIAPPGSRVNATLHVDALVFGNRRQTPGLEDGTSSTARAVWAGVIARFQIKRRYAVHAVYDFGRATTEWSGMSVREPGVTSARRVDSTQLFQVGLSIGL